MSRGRRVYVLRTQEAFYNPVIKVYGTYERAAKALHTQMEKLILNGKNTDEDIAAAQDRFIKECSYSLKKDNGHYEAGIVETHEVY